MNTLRTNRLDVDGGLAGLVADLVVGTSTTGAASDRDLAVSRRGIASRNVSVGHVCRSRASTYLLTPLKRVRV